MKKFFILIAFISTFVPALQSMEKLPESKNLKRSREVIDLTDYSLDNPVEQKRPKVEEVTTAARVEVVKKMVDWRPVNEVDAEYKSWFVQYTPKNTPKKTARKKEFMCFRCDTAFLNEKNLDMHNMHSYCSKQAKLALEKTGK